MKLETTLSDEMIQRLVNAGLTQQQATNKTAELVVQELMPEDEKELVKEAKRQVNAMQKMVEDLQRDYSNCRVELYMQFNKTVNNYIHEYNELLAKIESISKTVSAIEESQGEYGEISSEKGKDLIAIYGALLSMNSKYGKDAANAVQCASYIAYAYLGGQARRDVQWVDDTNVEKPKQKVKRKKQVYDYDYEDVDEDVDIEI